MLVFIIFIMMKIIKSKCKLPQSYLNPYLHYSNLVRNNSVNFHLIHKYKTKFFCTTNPGNNENFKRYDHEYESPENQDITFKSYFERVSLFLIKATALSTFIYFTFLKKYNEISKERELYFINEECENWLANKVSQKMQQKFSNLVFKEDSEENNLVNKVYTQILEKNKIKVLNKNVFVIKLPNNGCFLLKNGDLFVSSSLLDLTSSEEELAFMIAHEISIILNGKFLERILKSFINYKFFNSLGKMFLHGSINKPKVDYSEHRVWENLQLNFFLNFHPENPNITFFEHIAMFRVTLKLLENAGLDLNKV
jgi:hypothetical protein